MGSKRSFDYYRGEHSYDEISISGNSGSDDEDSEEDSAMPDGLEDALGSSESSSTSEDDWQEKTDSISVKSNSENGDTSESEEQSATGSEDEDQNVDDNVSTKTKSFFKSRPSVSATSVLVKGWATVGVHQSLQKERYNGRICYDSHAVSDAQEQAFKH